MPMPNMGGEVLVSVTLPRQRPLAVHAKADITMETGIPGLTNIKAFVGEREVALEQREFSLCVSMLNAELSRMLFKHVWEYALALAARVLDQDAYNKIHSTRDRGLARRKDGDELARTLRWIQNGLSNRVLRLPPLLCDSNYEGSFQQAESKMIEGFHLLKRMSGAMHGLRGSFFESLQQEAGAVIADAFPNGMPEEERRRSSVGYTRQHRGNADEE